MVDFKTENIEMDMGPISYSLHFKNKKYIKSIHVFACHSHLYSFSKYLLSAYIALSTRLNIGDPGLGNYLWSSHSWATGLNLMAGTEG